MSATVSQVNRVPSESYLDTAAQRMSLVYQVVLADGSNPLDFTFGDAITATDGTTSVPPAGDVQTISGTNYILGNYYVRPDERWPLKLYVRCDYAPSTASSGGGVLVWAKDLTIDGVAYTAPLYHDVYGKPVISSANGLLDPLPETELFNHKLTLSFLSKNIDLVKLESLRGSINSDTVALTVVTFRGPVYRRTYPALTLRCRNVSLKTQVADGAESAWSVGMELEAQFQKDDNGKEVGWTYLTPDRDTHKLVSGKRQAILEKDLSGGTGDGTAITVPTYLDGSGGVLDISGGASIKRLPFDRYPRSAFGPVLSQI